MHLDARTLRTLDWEVVLDRLAQRCLTLAGMRAARALVPIEDPDLIRGVYADVSEALTLDLPLGDVADIAPAVDAAARGGVLEAHALREVGATLRALESLRGWVADHDAVRLARLAAPIDLDPGLAETLLRAFDAAGEVSGETYPKVGQLRRQIVAVRARVRETVEELVRGDLLADALQDRFVTERDGRLVIPVKMGMRRGLGIVHGTSASGETAWVEPSASVELQNDLKAAEAELGHEIRRILTELSRAIAGASRRIHAALAAATVLDLVAARAALGIEMDASVPTVGSEGVVRLVGARHPVLVLRGVPVVGNDLSLDARQPALVLTGPNAGGKTVALKTIGLAALCVRCGIPIPAGEGSRVDVFHPILADIGDVQSVAGDLSTFSGHLAVLKEAVDRAAPGALVLLDEVAVGTDPGQGAALARAVVETVLDRGARIVLTTHYPELKAMEDARVAVGAMEYADGRPTYRLVLGAPGTSHAFAIARAMGLGEDVIGRATELLGDRERALALTMERLHTEREAVATRERALVVREEALAVREGKAVRELARRRDELATEFRDRLRAQEAELREMVAALQADPTIKGANAALAAVRAARVDEREPTMLPALAVGDTVRLKTGGQPGKLLAISGAKADVQMRTLRVRVDLADLEAAAAPIGMVAPVVAPSDAGSTVRTTQNTVDLRGMRLDEALTATELFLAGLSGSGLRYGYILHGHGTGVLKQGVRRWLKEVRAVQRFHAASEADGGDAFTVVELR